MLLEGNINAFAMQYECFYKPNEKIWHFKSFKKGN